MPLDRVTIRYCPLVDAFFGGCPAAASACPLAGSQGHEAEHVSECGLAGAADPAVWDYAISVDAVIVTKDEDSARRKVLDREGPVVVWIRLPNTRRRELLAWFETMLPRLLQALERGESLVEII